MGCDSWGQPKPEKKASKDSGKSDDLAKKSCSRKPRAAHKSHHLVMLLSKKQSQGKKKNHKKYPAVKPVYCKTQDIKKKKIIKLQENLEAQALTQQ